MTQNIILSFRDWCIMTTCIMRISSSNYKLFQISIKIVKTTLRKKCPQQTFILMKMPFVFTFRRRLQDALMKTNIFSLIIRLQKTSSRRLDEDKYILINHTSSEDVFKMFSRCLGQDQYIRLVHTSSRLPQDVFKTSSRRLANTSWRHLEDVLKTYHQVKLFLLTSLWEVFNMFVRRTAKTVVYRRIHLGHTSEKFMVSILNLQGW